HSADGTARAAGIVRSRRRAFRPAERRCRASPSCVLRQADTAELPTGMRWEEIAIAGAAMARRRGDGAAAQHHLADHELAIIFRRHAVEGPEAGVGVIGRARPFPYFSGVEEGAMAELVGARFPP